MTPSAIWRAASPMTRLRPSIKLCPNYAGKVGFQPVFSDKALFSRNSTRIRGGLPNNGSNGRGGLRTDQFAAAIGIIRAWRA
jgi:hypothetical protein